MGRTIIQPIGPLYGEAVNGTVFGRPNGSVYVPPTNTITAILGAEHIINTTPTRVVLCDENGITANNAISVVATAQDNAAYIKFELATDSAFTTIVATRNNTAGDFNFQGNNILFSGGGMPTIVDGSTYYFRAVLCASTNVAVAVSSTITLTGVVVE